jgi:hypothetical protein
MTRFAPKVTVQGVKVLYVQRIFSADFYSNLFNATCAATTVHLT